ncbi:toxin-activating lysine-acyltransferase [Reinekea sp.]|jgi:hemolysin-activating ACP:hemolysin acyltransferase|uniref:toxin-activating lysine-acyltransferase n=1 Tax=Reinekea sp. TaxID=1970455 RepID=UPI002A7EE15C|nr:toxin-activating lysine-acyltransferase [Reinekea sp.]
MDYDIESPLTAFPQADSALISNYARLGLVTDLALHQSDLADSSISGLIKRVCAASSVQQARFFFDYENRPYAYVSWAQFSKAEHHQLLAKNSGDLDQLEHFFIQREGAYLWFYDLICPFSSPLQIFKTLKQTMPAFSMAHLLQRSPLDENKRIRRIW